MAGKSAKSAAKAARKPAAKAGGGVAKPAPGKGARGELAAGSRAALLKTLKERFEEHEGRHGDVRWADVEARLEAQPGKLWSLHEMERTGGEPDVIGQDPKTGQVIFCDCSAESPAGRRSLCYDGEALASRKDAPPKGSAADAAAAMGAELLTEQEYLDLQELGRFDAKTSSWLKTPAAVRREGGALFGDFRYGRVWFYHNGAQSYYAARGFRALLRV